MVGSAERLAEEPEVCVASLEAAGRIARPLLAELSNPGSVLYAVASERIAGLPPADRLGIAPLLLTDPSKSGVIVERYRLQGGELPEDATDEKAEKMAALWASDAAAIPPLRVPEGAEPKVMDLGDRLQMRGGGPVVFAREEVAQMAHLPKTLVQVVAAANNASRQRVESALAYVETHDLEQPIVATANRFRVLKDKERETVAGFAPKANNELELFVDSAIDKGFEPASADNRYGVRFLPDDSAYLIMRHPNGTKMVVLAPVQHVAADGSKKTGVFNAYSTLTQHPEVVSDEFQFEGSDIIHVTSSHYGPMAAMNNLRAVDELRTSVSSFRVIGDNQPARTAQAHLIEVGLTANALDEMMDNPRIAPALQ